MLAAMMGGGGIAGTKVDLVALGGSWVVPGGVTSVRVYAYAAGGTVGVSAPYTTTDGGGGGAALAGGGGGGAWVAGVTLAVTPGDTATLSSSGTPPVHTMTLSGKSVQLGNGHNAGVLNNNGGAGGDASVNIGGVTSVSGGFGGVWPAGSPTGGNGGTAAVAGGVITGGGGGGKGAIVSPAEGPFAGGSSGTFTGPVGPGFYGAGGGGVFSGQMAISASVVTGTGTTVFTLYHA